MENYPRNLTEFDKYFSTESDCREYLFRLRWPNGFHCPQCSHKKAWTIGVGLYECPYCGHQTSVTAGTIFQDTRKPLKLWFQAIWYVVGQKNGVSALGLQRVLGITRYETVWIWLHKLRAAMVRPSRDRLSGAVEVDETYIGGKRHGKRGRGAVDKSLVFIAVEDKGNHFGRIRLRRIVDASATSLISAVKASVVPGSVVRTDGWSGYSGLASESYKHSVVRQSADIGENMLPLANRVAALLKRWLQGTHQGAVRVSHLNYYLDEFTFRFNRRTSRSRGKLFYRLLQQGVTIKPVKGKSI